MSINWSELKELALGLELPKVEETTSWGQPTLKAHGKMWVFWSPSEDCPVIKTLPGDREMLLEVDPDTFYITPHYQPHNLVLVRPAAFDPDWARDYLTKSWRVMAPQRWLKTWDAEQNA
ncbi:MAG: MmcQ/YjbR family DNA-binding protein [Parvularculaceae bacterium]|nr:MmcQ/YjbR family DNA-binding protein [Parvularculaceae bacterium]